MKRLFMYGAISIIVALSACTDDGHNELLQTSEPNADGITSVKLSSNQAMMFANMLANVDDGELDGAESRSLGDRVISDVQYYVSEGDTLMYLFNYADNAGYMLLGADFSSSPIIANSREGRLDLDNIDSESYLSELLANNAERIRHQLSNPEITDPEYIEDWGNLGQEGYEYIVEVADEPTDIGESRGTSRRKYSSGKQKVYPYTGKDLNCWDQRGGYNMNAPNQACIGCPAITIGMLLYDVALRFDGNHMDTTPLFEYADIIDISKSVVPTSLSRRLRTVADNIPSYMWGTKKDAPSGAYPNMIRLGLRNLGFKDASYVKYNFETLYSNLSFVGKNTYGIEQVFHRGVPIFGYSKDRSLAHIWFCDGYYEQSYKVTKKFLGITIKSWTEYDDRIYMNWGGGPTAGNGWYAASESKWTSLNGKTYDLKENAQMFINLSNYVKPEKIIN